MLNALETRADIALALPPAEQGLHNRCDHGTRGAHVWPLRDDWSTIIQAARQLRSLIVGAGDNLCRMTLRVPVAWGDGPHSYQSGPGDGAWEVDTSRWACGMAIQEQLDDGRLRRGLVFYDGVGRLVLRSDLDASAPPGEFHALVRRFARGSPLSSTATRTGPGAVTSIAPDAVQRACGAIISQGAADAATNRQASAVPLGNDAVLEALRHARAAGIEISAILECRGVRLRWDGLVQALAAQRGWAMATGRDFELQWSEASAALEARVMREPTAAGLVQTIAVQSPGGDTRLLLRPASPAHAGAHPQPCAWRAAIEAALGGRCGQAC